MTALLMPKGTAVWLIENTTLTFEQIGDFCNLHPLEIQAIADGEIIAGMHGHDPVAAGQLSLDEIEQCQADPTKKLRITTILHQTKARKKAKYTPLALRQAKPSGVAWLLKEIPNITNADIIRIIGTTKTTIQAIRLKTHRSIGEIKPVNPAYLGLCKLEELNELIQKYKDDL